MNSNRKLDFLVAEYVMGWEYRWESGLWTHNASRQWSVQEQHVPHYSGDMRQAQKVLETLQRLGLELALKNCDDDWQLQIYERDGPSRRYCLQSTWFPEAAMSICEAAVRHKGVVIDLLVAALSEYDIVRGVARKKPSAGGRTSERPMPREEAT